MSEKLRTIQERGYYGISFDALPGELQGRVRAAAQVTKRLRGWELHFDEVSADRDWEYGDYNNAFVIDNGSMHQSYHRVGDKIYKSWLAGGGTHEEIAEIAGALGLEESADVIREPRTPRNERERQLMPNGPVLGTK